MPLKTNRNHKSSVFATYFQDKDKLIEVYNAVEGADYPKETSVQINTLENVLYMDQINDISFLLDDKLLVLIEHQSTNNENMPLRLLLYIARVYEKILDNQNIYREKLIQIPRPEFLVLYNGTEDYPDYSILKLSDAFMKKDARHETMELTVKVYNINQGHNSEILEKSRSLHEYAAFIARIRENRSRHGKTLATAVREAIIYCVRNDIMKDFLERNSSEVENMLMTEFNLEDALKVRYEEGWEGGREKGREEERLQILKEMIEDGDSLEKIARITKLSIETIQKHIQ